MTNEELAVRIKAGEAGLYGELWENMRRLIGREALRFIYCTLPVVTARA